MKELDELIDEIYVVATSEVERIARKELRNNPELYRFTMAMGTYFFESKFDDILHDYECEELDQFMSDYDWLNISGCSMKFTTYGKIITDW